MTDRSDIADRIKGSRATLLGPEDSLENIVTTTLDDGSFCYVIEEHLHYELHRDDTTPANPPLIIAPIAGPGRWVPATGGTTGAQGFQGNQGSQGAQGTQGAGFQGAQGFQGATGVQGFQGSQGFQGAGTQGAQGNTGAQGPGGGAQGAQGATGVQGFQGAQGFQGGGFQGAQGGTGVQGFQGSLGAQGAQGFQGGQGFQGAQGRQGNTGTTGAQGAQGFQGNTGTTGAQGATGVQGSQGFQGGGFQGAQGFQGQTGPGGGAQGAQGATGVQGFQGAQGFQGGGFQGATGATGAQGFQGATGLTGAQGAQGFQGNTGTTGAQGNQGFQGGGFQGATGATGAQGGQGFQGAQGRQGNTGTTGTTGAQGAQGFQGNTGATGTTGNTGAQGAQGFQGATGAQGFQGATGTQGSQGSQAAGFGPLTQFFYVDSANVGTANGSIAQPYASPTAAFTAHPTGNITLAIAPATYATALTIGGARDITLLGLGSPNDPAIILGSIALAFTTTNGFTLTLENVSCTTITDTSAVQSNIALIDSHASGTITGSGTTATSTVVQLSSTTGQGHTNITSVAAVTSVAQVIGQNATLTGVFSSAHATGETLPNTFDNCSFASAPTTGPLLCTNCSFPSGLAAPGASTINRLNNCSIDGNMTAGAANTDQMFLNNCKIGEASATATLAIGPWGGFNIRNTSFGPKSSGSVTIDPSLSNFALDSTSERSLFKSGQGNGAISSSGNSWIALDEGESDAQTILDSAGFVDFSSAPRLVLTKSQLTLDRTLTISNSGSNPLEQKLIDVYGTNGHTLTIAYTGGAGATTLAIPSTNPFARYVMQVSEDGAVLVFVGQESFT
jgi:hypothetical protein